MFISSLICYLKHLSTLGILLAKKFTCRELVMCLMFSSSSSAAVPSSGSVRLPPVSLSFPRRRFSRLEDIRHLKHFYQHLYDLDGVYIPPNKGHNGRGKKSGILRRGKKNQGEKQKWKGKKKEKEGKRRQIETKREIGYNKGEEGKHRENIGKKREKKMEKWRKREKT